MYNSELSADNGSSPQFRNTIDRTVAIRPPLVAEGKKVLLGQSLELCVTPRVPCLAGRLGGHFLPLVKVFFFSFIEKIFAGELIIYSSSKLLSRSFG